ncbi:unnamed protein product, partial [Brenthis ino]
MIYEMVIDVSLQEGYVKIFSFKYVHYSFNYWAGCVDGIWSGFCLLRRNVCKMYVTAICHNCNILHTDTLLYQAITEQSQALMEQSQAISISYYNECEDINTKKDFGVPACISHCHALASSPPAATTKNNISNIHINTQ